MSQNKLKAKQETNKMEIYNLNVFTKVYMCIINHATIKDGSHCLDNYNYC